MAKARSRPSRPSMHPEELIGYRVRRLAALLDQHGRLLAREGLGLAHAEWHLIFTLRLLGSPSNPHVAAAHAGLERSHVTQVVRSLRRRRLVSQRGDPADARRVVLALTKNGLALYERGIANAGPRRALLSQALTPAERTVFERALAKLTHAAERMVSDRKALPKRRR